MIHCITLCGVYYSDAERFYFPYSPRKPCSQITLISVIISVTASVVIAAGGPGNYLMQLCVCDFPNGP